MDSKTLMVGGSCLALGAAAGILISKLTKPGIRRLTKDGGPWEGFQKGFAAPILIHDGKVYISGQVGWKGDPQAVGPWEEAAIASDIEGQTQRTLEKIDALLKAAGTSKDNIIDTQVRQTETRLPDTLLPDTLLPALRSRTHQRALIGQCRCLSVARLSLSCSLGH